MNKLTTQWLKLLKLPTAPNRLTRDLYEFLSVRSGFIAHFDRAGFHRSRFQTLSDFDRTIELMKLNAETFALLESADTILIANARFQIAAMEASLLKKQAEVLNWHVERLQSQFTKALI